MGVDMLPIIACRKVYGCSGYRIALEVAAGPSPGAVKKGNNFESTSLFATAS